MTEGVAGPPPEVEVGEWEGAEHGVSFQAGPGTLKHLEVQTLTTGDAETPVRNPSLLLYLNLMALYLCQ